MEFKRNNQLYKNIYNPTYKRFIAASRILIDFLKYPFGDYFLLLVLILLSDLFTTFAIGYNVLKSNG